MSKCTEQYGADMSSRTVSRGLVWSLLPLFWFSEKKLAVSHSAHSVTACLSWWHRSCMVCVFLCFTVVWRHCSEWMAKVRHWVAGMGAGICHVAMVTVNKEHLYWRNSTSHCTHINSICRCAQQPSLLPHGIMQHYYAINIKLASLKCIKTIITLYLVTKNNFRAACKQARSVNNINNNNKLLLLYLICIMFF